MFILQLDWPVDSYASLGEPFPALLNESEKYLSETYRICIVPSRFVDSKQIQDSPADHHSQTGSLIVGDLMLEW